MSWRKTHEPLPWWMGKPRHWGYPPHFTRWRGRYRHRQQRALAKGAIRRGDFDAVPGKRPRCLFWDYW